LVTCETVHDLKNKKKIEPTIIPKIDPPAIKPETLPTKDPNSTQPTIDSTPIPNLPQNPEGEK
jgi:hypothetical protein